MYEKLSDILNDSKLVHSEVYLDEDTDLDAPAEVVLVYNDKGYGPMMGADLLLFVNSGRSVESCLEDGFEWVEENSRDQLDELISEQMAELGVASSDEEYDDLLMEAEDRAKAELHESVMYLEFTDLTNREVMDEFRKVTYGRNVRELNLDELEELVGESRTAMVRRASSAPVEFLIGYLDAALWSSTDGNGEPLDTYYELGDLSPEAKLQAKKDCDRFYSEVMAKIDLDDVDYDEAMAGHDFWLTRNRHGAGFWDREELPEEVRKQLTAAAKRFGEVDLYIGDDRRLYFS